MQAQLAKAQEEAASEVVEASAGGGMVTVKANGAGEVLEITIDPKAIDSDAGAWRSSSRPATTIRGCSLKWSWPRSTRRSAPHAA
jgi:YbaB/EbfC DNA-binding family